MSGIVGGIGSKSKIVDGGVVNTSGAITTTGVMTATAFYTTGTYHAGVYYVNSAGASSYYTSNIAASTWATVAAGSTFSDGDYLVSAIVHDNYTGHALYTMCYNASSPGGQVGSIISSGIAIRYTSNELQVMHSLSGNRYIRVTLQKLSYDV